MPVFITLNLHPGQEKSTVNSICQATVIPIIFTDDDQMKYTTDTITGTMFSTEGYNCIVLLRTLKVGIC